MYKHHSVVPPHSSLTERKNVSTHSAVTSIHPSLQIGRRSTIQLVIAALFILCLPSLNAATATPDISDSAITGAVENALMKENGVFPNDVDVTTSQGIVTLTGTGGHMLAKERAVQIAMSIRGVRSVIDEIKVTPVSRPDADIRKDIMSALLYDPATESYQVAVSVKDAAVTLTGSVGSYMERRLAERIAKGVKGSKEVSNDITINYTAKRTDAEMEADIKARLQWDIWIDDNMISTAVKDGKVTLSGEVGSATVKSRAYNDAWVLGVKSVDDSKLSVNPWVKNEDRSKNKYPVRSENDIKLAIEASLRLDPRVSAYSPEVSVNGGVVRLSGSVGDLKAKASAEQDAQNTVGVWQVDNNLKIRAKLIPTDADITSQLTSALYWNSWLYDASITATVKNRVATLTGTVESSFQKAEAQDAAARTKGVLSVRNQLEVVPDYWVSDYAYYPSYDYGYYGGYGSYGWPYYNQWPYNNYQSYWTIPYRSDEQIKKNIESSIFWSPYVRSDDIKVTVDGGVATLSGTVGSWIGWREADRDARDSGATSVLNRVVIK